jgi:hypothetical protein
MFIDFFKPEDFQHSSRNVLLSSDAADLANQKLAKEGLIIHGKLDKNRHPSNWWTTLDGDVHEGILINIKEIKCEHPASKIKCKGIIPDGGGYWFQCECGANVVADTFKEI